MVPVKNCGGPLFFTQSRDCVKIKVHLSVMLWSWYAYQIEAEISGFEMRYVPCMSDDINFMFFMSHSKQKSKKT
jgi:hypothetical protein